MRHFISLVCYFLLLILSSCQSANSTKPKDAALEVRDAAGTLVSLPKEATRVVCLFEPILDELYMLGVGEKVQGISLEILSDADYFQDYSKLDSRILTKTIATPGTEAAANVEKIVSLRPDLVILENTQTATAEKLRNMQIAVYLCKSQEYADIMQELRDLSLLTGVKARGDTLAKAVETELEYMRKHSKNQQAQKAYFTWAYGKIFSTIGQQSMMNTCLKLAGVKNVCTAPLYRVDIQPETLISWNPDLIITWNDSASNFYNRQEFQTINAIKKRAIHNLLPMFFFNPHNIKAICTALRINGVAYGNLTENNQRIIKFLQLIYGSKLAPELLSSFQKHI